MDRRLAAILAADVASFSALVGADEEGTLRALKGHMSAIEPIIGLHGGRVVKTMGDGFLAEFSSVVDAVAAADTMQRRLFERNSERGDGPELLFRMGVHVGDIVVDGDDILGDGVNIAARLESIADPGGIIVSARVHEDVDGKLDLTFHDLGLQNLKNITRSIHVFAVDQPKLIAVTPVLPARSEKPSVAVLAFDSLSSDTEQEYFADGITEDIITGLCRVPWLFVIARNSSFSYKGLSVDIRQIGRELGVRYVLEGSVRKAGQMLRVSGQLIDAETGTHIWAENYDGKLEDIFELQDRITEAVVNAIAPKIRTAEIARSKLKRPERLEAYDFYLRGQASVGRFQLKDAVIQLQNALRAAPEFVEAKALLAWTSTLVWHPEYEAAQQTLETGVRFAREVLQVPDSDVEALAYAGYVVAWGSDEHDFGQSFVNRALTAAPSCFSAWSSSCLLYGMRGDTEMAQAHGEVALRLNPRDPLAYRVHMGLAWGALAARDWDGLWLATRNARAFADSVRSFRLYEITVLHHRGERAQARKLSARVLARYPDLSVSAVRTYIGLIAIVADGTYDPILDALAASGFPE
ncbi:MAG: adenylate/guanylate cyclase domain-containing protein [Pseudomonadota bacterium]